ncbi:uncharacterized protein LOC123407518 isoform X1 [Hordeum vulgare subsp. vulgare]|uniref:RAB6A-GEF complex partner protein 2 n=1 Tax=Hordeum vulgare subsp. vulgare TaxID=112509 RepID=A0A8I6Z709_HORVV|nr:uncharacterized protein LOC123407518 isoform X1 [Hordeum vulgare subsp. vulgare]XP_044956603.1 uncharacterized protein LOC123407518 isoform X1 [Hordeum vulgare subsp. vulgare]XP_044956604.1 uncharacterized protein LOC123407518 isoform X1 [Hordeum vulgare subsp. vulgare]
MSLRLPLPQGLSFFKSVGWFEDSKVDSAAKHHLSPKFKLQTDKEVYRPGDSVTATIEISSPSSLKDEAGTASGGDVTSLLVDGLSFELKGIEKLDSQWFSVPKPLPGSKQRRGEYLFLDCSAPSLVSKVIIASGQTKTYIVRLELPKILPPSYRGISIRYIYYVRSTLLGRLIDLGNEDQTKGNVNSAVQLETRVPLQICVSQKSSNLLNEEGSFPLSVEQLSIFWREKDDDSEWSKANDNTDLEEGYDSSKDEVSSVSSYNPSKSNTDFPIRTSTSTHSLSSRLSTNEALYSQGERPTFPLYNAIPRLSVSEISDDHGGGAVSPLRKLDHLHLDHHPSNGQRFSLDSDRPKDDVGLPLTPKHVEPSGSEGFMRGRSYNIRIDDQVLLRFSPKNSDSTYYFGDMIGGALTFFHGTGTRRCLEVSITLETSETINPRVIHPSRRVSPTITKVHSEHHEVVADLHQTSFLFSIPIEGPMSFATSKVTVQWSLRFEFFTTPAGMDSSRYEHPLLVEKREKGDWVLPITVYAPPMRRRATHGRNGRSALVGNLFNS